jgi:hypothetical protein
MAVQSSAQQTQRWKIVDVAVAAKKLGDITCVDSFADSGATTESYICTFHDKGTLCIPFTVPLYRI